MKKICLTLLTTMFSNLLAMEGIDRKEEVAVFTLTNMALSHADEMENTRVALTQEQNVKDRERILRIKQHVEARRLAESKIKPTRQQMEDFNKGEEILFRISEDLVSKLDTCEAENNGVLPPFLRERRSKAIKKIEDFTEKRTRQLKVLDFFPRDQVNQIFNNEDKVNMFYVKLKSLCNIHTDINELYKAGHLVLSVGNPNMSELTIQDLLVGFYDITQEWTNAIPYIKDFINPSMSVKDILYLIEGGSHLITAEQISAVELIKEFIKPNMTAAEIVGFFCMIRASGFNPVNAVKFAKEFIRGNMTVKDIESLISHGSYLTAEQISAAQYVKDFVNPSTSVDHIGPLVVFGSQLTAEQISAVAVIKEFIKPNMTASEIINIFMAIKSMPTLPINQANAVEIVKELIEPITITDDIALRLYAISK